ncbi:MAG: hypothetical protein ACJAT2_001030 [Bacteriovoracaceae bacterium]|jgi:hypothetical protein
MSFSDIRALKKEESNETVSRFVRHLVVGEDLYSVALYKSLLEKFGNEEVQLLCQSELSPLEILPKGPSSLRGQVNIESFKKLFPNIEIKEVEGEAEYFKEQEFRKFSGRGKPEALLWGEAYFKEPRADIDLSQIYPFINDLEFFKNLNEKKWDNTLTGLTQVQSTDLIENSSWSLKTSNGEELNCEKLYWGAGPQSFLNHYEDKNKLGDKFIEFCESTITPASLYIKFIFEENITDKTETIFVPLSYTHEWGHFIGEFGDVDGKQSIEFVLHIDINQQNEEDISRKIRLLKRHIEKIFKKSKKVSCEEFITLDKNSPCPNIDDSLYQEAKDSVKNLHLVSVNGPFEDSAPMQTIFEDSECAPTHLMRALARQKEIVGQL